MNCTRCGLKNDARTNVVGDDLCSECRSSDPNDPLSERRSADPQEFDEDGIPIL